MIDAQGNPKTLEFNCRMGDPETQPIMARLKGDFSKVVELAIAGTLRRRELEWDRRTALGVVLAAHNYPDTPRKGDRISGIPAETENAVTFHAGTTLVDGKLDDIGRTRAVRRRVGRTRCAARNPPPTIRSTRSRSTACSIAATSAIARVEPQAELIAAADPVRRDQATLALPDLRVRQRVLQGQDRLSDEGARIRLSSRNAQR